MIEQRPDEPFEEVWDEYEETDGADAPGWRKPVLIVVAAVTAVAIALVPLYSVFRSPTIADNGLEVCGFDYCIVQEAAVEAGVDLVMSRLHNTFVDEDQARELAADLTDHLDVPPVRLEVADRLGGRLGGAYEPDTRTIRVEAPVRAWTVVHEVAHTVATGHGPEFQAAVIDLARWVGSTES